MKSLLSLAVWGTLCSLAWAQNAATTPTPASPPPAVAPAPSNWIFSLLPASLQKNPRLNYTVMTEKTDAGKRLAPVSPGQPAYYVAFSAGFREIGDTYYGEKTLTPDTVEKILAKSLATTGYLPADAAHPPTLLIIYSWGAHNRVSETESQVEVEANLLDSAALVGGERFARKLSKMVLQTDEMAGPRQLVDFANPINLYRDSGYKHNAMLDQAVGDLYFVVASAYDYQTAAANQRTLLWRSRMTVSSAGVSQEQTLPALIISAAPYFGRDMQEPEVFNQRREGHVNVGPIRVMDVGRTPTQPPAPDPPR